MSDKPAGASVGYFPAVTASLPPIVLRNGTRIDSVLELALEFVEHDGSYQSYDLAPVKQDDVLTESDIRVANATLPTWGRGRVDRSFRGA